MCPEILFCLLGSCNMFSCQVMKNLLCFFPKPFLQHLILSPKFTSHLTLTKKCFLLKANEDGAKNEACLFLFKPRYSRQLASRGTDARYNRSLAGMRDIWLKITEVIFRTDGLTAARRSGRQRGDQPFAAINSFRVQHAWATCSRQRDVRTGLSFY